MSQLRPYQEYAAAYLRDNPRSALWLEPGLGKTATVLTAHRPNWGRVLVLAPKLVAESVWPEEARAWRPDLTLSLATGTQAQRRAALAAPADMYVLSYDNASDAAPYQWDTVIADESSKLKTPSTSRFKTVRKLTASSTRIHLLTGTPAPNGLADLWSQMYLLDRGERLGRTATEFRYRHFYPAHRLPNGIVTEWRMNEGAEERIHSLLSDIVLGMQASYRLTLPPITFTTHPVALPEDARAVYRSLQSELLSDLTSIFGPDYETVTAGNAAILSSKLSQVASGALYVDLESERAGDALPLHTAKYDALEELLGELEGSPALVFYRFRFEAEEISRRLPHSRSIKEPGILPLWNAGGVPILYAHPASAAHGLNLQHGGHHVVWVSPTWELEHWEQANARLARPGQTSPVVIHSLIATSTIDSRVIARVERKQSLQLTLKEAMESPI